MRAARRAASDGAETFIDLFRPLSRVREISINLLLSFIPVLPFPSGSVHMQTGMWLSCYGYCKLKIFIGQLEIQFILPNNGFNYRIYYVDTLIKKSSFRSISSKQLYSQCYSDLTKLKLLCIMKGHLLYTR